MLTLDLLRYTKCIKPCKIGDAIAPFCIAPREKSSLTLSEGQIPRRRPSLIYIVTARRRCRDEGLLDERNSTQEVSADKQQRKQNSFLDPLFIYLFFQSNYIVKNVPIHTDFNPITRYHFSQIRARRDATTQANWKKILLIIGS